MFLVIILTAYYFYFFWFEHSFNICIGRPKCSTGRGETTAWLCIFLRHAFSCFLNFSLSRRGMVRVRSMILSRLLSSPLGLPRQARAVHSVILKLLEGKLPSQQQFRLEGTSPAMKWHSQAGPNVFFSFFFPGVCLWLMHSLPHTMPSTPLTEGEHVASTMVCSCLRWYC